MLEQLDKDLNTFSMRIKEWYSWHFPELAKIVSDNEIYVRLVVIIGNKSDITEEKRQLIEEIVLDSDIAN